MSPDKMGQVYILICVPIVALFVGIGAIYVGFKRLGGIGVLLGVIVLVVLLGSSVAYVIPPISQVESQRLALEKFDKANHELHSILDRFLDVAGVEKIVDGYQFLNDPRANCYHTRAYALYGMSQDAQTAFNKLVKDLEAAGWVSEGTSQERQHMFAQGDNAQLSVEYGSNYRELWRQRGEYDKYLSAIEKYSNTLNVGIDYMLPGWKECGGL